MDRMRRFVPLLLLAALSAALVSLGSARAEDAAPLPLDPTTRDFDQIHLDITVTPDLEQGTVKGSVAHRFAALRAGLAQLRLHCEDTRITSVKDAQGVDLKHAVAGGILTIELAAPLARDAEANVVIDYVSTPTRGLYFHRPTEACPGTPWFMYSQGQGTDNRRWIPCYDEPDDRCSWTVTVTAAANLQTVSNGVLAQSLPGDNLRTDRWVFDGRSPTYLISLIVAPLETITKQHGNIRLDFSAVPGHREALETSLAETANMLDFFGDYIQAPYPWPRYAQTYVWDFLYGGMENVTATTLNMRALHTAAVRPNYRSDGLVAHELAHMWFGDLLTCRTWKHIWLNEGFATYFTDLFFEHRYGTDEFLLRRRGQNRGYIEGTPKPSELKLEADPRGDIPLELFGGKQYSRGAAILHNLRRHLGDDVFRDAIRSYVKRHRDNPVTSEDLRKVAEDIAGEDLAWFWNQWVYGLGYPKLDVRYDAGQEQLIVQQTQRQAGGQGLFRLRVPIRWGADGPTQVFTIHQARHAFPMKATGAYLRFGVGGDLLMGVTQHQTPTAWGEQLAQDPDVTARLDAAEALEAFGPVAIPALATALRDDPSQAVRKGAAEVLGRLDGPGAAEGLLGGTGDPDPRVREAVMTALGAKNRRVAGAAVVQAAAGDVHPYVRAAAARALGKLKGEAAYDQLVALLGVDADQDVIRTGAAEGLKHLGDVRAVPVLLPYLDYLWGKGANHVLRKAVFDALTALAPDDEAVHGRIVALLADPHHRARSWAAEACGTYKIRAAIPTLIHIRDTDSNAGLKAAARKALERLEVKEPK